MSNRIEELLKIIRSRQEDILVQMDSHAQDIQGLRELVQEMQKSPAFDPEDVSTVEDQIKSHAKQHSKLAKHMEEEEVSRQAHEELFVYLNDVIEDRQRILDSVDGSSSVLATHPELLQYLARKQLNLQKIMADKLETLAQPSCAAKTS